MGIRKSVFFGKDLYVLPINFILSSKIKTRGAPRSEIHPGIINFNIYVLKCKNTFLN